MPIPCRKGSSFIHWYYFIWNHLQFGTKKMADLGYAQTLMHSHLYLCGCGDSSSFFEFRNSCDSNYSTFSYFTEFSNPDIKQT